MEHKAGEGLGSKIRNRATGARFQVRRWKRQLRVMQGGGRVVQMRCRWWQGGAFAKRKAGRGFGTTCETKPPWLGFGRLIANSGGG